MDQQPFTTAGPYRRTPAFDRRLEWGDDFAGDAWTEPGGVVFWTPVGIFADGERTFTVCRRCRGAGHTQLSVDGDLCPDCSGSGWRYSP